MAKFERNCLYYYILSCCLGCRPLHYACSRNILWLITFKINVTYNFTKVKSKNTKYILAWLYWFMSASIAQCTRVILRNQLHHAFARSSCTFWRTIFLSRRFSFRVMKEIVIDRWLIFTTPHDTTRHFHSTWVVRWFYITICRHGFYTLQITYDLEKSNYFNVGARIFGQLEVMCV